MATVQAALAFITYYTGFYLHLSTYKRYLALQFHTYIHLCYLTLVDRSEIGEVYKVSLDPTVEELCPVSSMGILLSSLLHVHRCNIIMIYSIN